MRQPHRSDFSWGDFPFDGRLLALRENPVQANDVIETGLQRAGIQGGELEVAHPSPP